jgi:cytochrome P450
LRAIIAKRETEKVSKIDFLQLMLDARNKTDSKDVDEDIKQDIEKLKLSDKKREFKIEEIDILATSLLFILAGYETTASTLSYLFHELSLNPECQEKLYQEIVSYEGNVDYETIAKMDYLDACVSETLRMYSPLVITSRVASEDYTLGKNIFFR